MTIPERTDERDAALDALVAMEAFPGWTIDGLRAAAGPDSDLLFPGGVLDMVESWFDLVDRRMPPAPGERVPDRVRAVIAARLASLRPAKEAVRRGVGILIAHPATATRVTARTIDAVWHAAGDRSADWNWYSKRAILAGVYSATLLYWMRDESDDDAATLSFLDRRLAGVGRLGRLRRSGPRFLARCRREPTTLEPRSLGGVAVQ